MRAHHRNAHRRLWREAANLLHGRQGLTGRALRQTGAVVIALTKVCKLQVAAAAAYQGDAKWKAIWPEAAGHRDRCVVEQIHEVGIRAEVTVKYDRIFLYLVDRVVRRRGRQQQNIDDIPHGFSLLTQHF